MGININGVNSISKGSNIFSAQAVRKLDSINTVFTIKEGNYVNATYFNADEQHTLGILALGQDNVMIED